METYQSDRLGMLGASERAIVAKQVGEAHMRLGRKQDALEYLRLSYKLDKDAIRKKDTVAKIELLKADIKRDERNQARQPKIHLEVDQENVVRPRLVARNTKPAAATPEAGRAQ
jgi:hypothetical protein